MTLAAAINKVLHRENLASSEAEAVLDLIMTGECPDAQIGALLTRMGQPEKGLEVIRETMRLATANDPGMGFWCLFASEAELELGHEQAALDWVQRASTLMPGSPLVQAWLASVYIAIGDHAKAAKYAAALKAMAPFRSHEFAGRQFNPTPPGSWPRTRILEGLRVALAGPLG